jgi:Ca2+-binding RTX toxin-like protein
MTSGTKGSAGTASGSKSGNGDYFGGGGGTKPDLTVNGTAGSDIMLPGYVDAQGDTIDGADGIDDIIYAYDGNDTVVAGNGDDTVYGGAGNDSIYGDNNGRDFTVRESFEWNLGPSGGSKATGSGSKAFGSGSKASGSGGSGKGSDATKGFTQNTGNVDVTFKVESSSQKVDNSFEDTKQNVAGINGDGQPIDPKSSFQSETNGKGQIGEYSLSFSAPVTDVSFNINDIDGDGIVKVLAYDAHGNLINVDMTGGSDVALKDTDCVFGADTADSNGGYANDNSKAYSINVSIPGPVARIVIVHSQDGTHNSGVNITDVYFDAPVSQGGDPAGDDVLFGGLGDDIIYGEGGNDSLYGGAGADKVYGGDDRDTIYGGAGDSVDGGAGGDDYDVLVLNDGEIYITTGPGGTGSPVLDADGNSFSGRVVFTDANGVPTGEYIDYTEIEEIRGGTPLRDGTVFGTEGNDTMGVGYADPTDGDLIDGNDAILAGDTGNDDLIYGLGGNDTINAGEGNDEVYGGIGNDSIMGGNGADTVYGDAGNDIVRGGNGNDTVFGGIGDDTGFGGDGDDLVYGGAGNDQLNGNAGNDTVYGGEGNDTVSGQTGDDVLYGDAGNDIINGDAGNDVAYGGDGDDIIDTSNHVDPGFDNPYPGLPGDANTQNDLDTVFGGAGNDTIVTGDDADVIYGGTGNDRIDAGIDNDYVEGGEGDDTIIGGEGVDTIYGDAGDDLIYGGLANDTLDIMDHDANGNPVDLLPDNNKDTIYGGDGNDTIFGRDDDDTIYGDAGNDTIFGGIDDDVIFGGDGNDVLSGDQGNDVISGDAGNDVISGGIGLDTIYGGDGDDTIASGADADAVFGGLGSDRFTDVSSGDVITGGEDPDGTDVDTFNFDQETLDKIDRIERNGGAGDSEELRESGTIYFKDGTTASFSQIEAPCFTPGTTIATPTGERLVEDLRAGDKIITRDHGIQEIAWVGSKEITGKELAAKPHMKPILVKAGSLGQGLPERDMLLSPNHRVLVASEKTQLYFEEREVLAAAKHMTGAQGIHTLDVMRTTYIHFMFERHEVVLSNGAWTESFHPGDYSLNGLGNNQRNEIFELFPELATTTGLEGYHAARKSLKKHEARLLMK